MNARYSPAIPEANVAPTMLPVLPVVTPERPHLPASRAEMEARGWDSVDVVFVTGDAYVDHPAFAMGILGRVLEAAGFRVAILSQPDWQSAEPWRQFGRPRLFFGISAGNMDSMINHYTANKKVRNDDAYSPGGRIGLRPDRATHPLLPAGPRGLSRRAGHRRWRRGLAPPAGPLRLLERHRPAAPSCSTPRPTWSSSAWASTRSSTIARRLAAGETVKDLRDMRGVAYALGASESQPPADAIVLPSYEEVKTDKHQFARATKIIHQETNPLNAKRLVQFHDRQAVVCNPPPLAGQPGRHGPDLRPALHAHGRTRCTRGRRSPPMRS